MTTRDDQTPTVEQIAEQIASDDYACEANGYASWESAHSCGTYYGCCGGGKEIDRAELAKAIAAALHAAEARGEARGRQQGHDFMREIDNKREALWQEVIEKRNAALRAVRFTRIALEHTTAMCRAAITWPADDIQGLRFHAQEAAREGMAALTQAASPASAGDGQ